MCFIFLPKKLFVSFNLNAVRFHPLFSNFHSSRFLLRLSGVRAAVYENILLSSVGCLPLLLLLICVHPFVFLQKVACIILSSRFCVFLFYFLYFCDTPGRDSGGKKYNIFALPGKLTLSARKQKNPAATAALSVRRVLFWETRSEYFRQTNKNCFCFSLSIFTLLKFYSRQPD